MLVFETEQDWLLVQNQKEGAAAAAGFVPGNYVEPHTKEQQAPAASQIVVPPPVSPFFIRFVL